MDPGKYIEKMMTSYQQIFGAKPRTSYQTPLEPNDHPELDDTEFLDEDGTQKYQSAIGSLQWLISIGRFDIMTHVMSLSSFRAQPRMGHLKRVKRLYGYIYRTRHYCIKFRTGTPEMSQFNNKLDMDWDRSVYEANGTEPVLPQAPDTLGNKVTLIHYFDANLLHDMLSGKAVTGCIHLANQTPMMWYSKKQATTETATFGAEFVAARTCIEQIIDLRTTFRYLGVEVTNVSYMFGDNESMINNASFPYARLHKRHHLLSFHYVRAHIAQGYIALHHITSKSNIADIVSKHWAYGAVKGLLKPIFYTIGNTRDLYVDDTVKPENQ